MVHLKLTQRRVEVVVDVFEESVVFADFGADVDGQRLERVHLSSKLLFKLVVLQDEKSRLVEFYHKTAQ